MSDPSALHDRFPVGMAVLAPPPQIDTGHRASHQLTLNAPNMPDDAVPNVGFVFKHENHRVFNGKIIEESPTIRVIFANGDVDVYSAADVSRHNVVELRFCHELQGYQHGTLANLQKDLVSGVFAAAHKTSPERRIVYRHPNLKVDPADPDFLAEARAHEVPNGTEAEVLMRSCAAKARPELAVCYGLGVGAHRHTRTSNTICRRNPDPSINIQDRVEMMVDRMNEDEIEGIVTEAMNSIYDRLGAYGALPDLANRVGKAASHYVSACIEYGTEELEFEQDNAPKTTSFGP